MHSTNDLRSTRPHLNSMSRVGLTGVRIVVGWHFLYEGVAKLFATNWSSAGFLRQSNWLLSDMFHWMAANQTALKVVDFLNVWGLILIGLGLFSGLFTRIASAAGAILLALYYIASPPSSVRPVKRSAGAISWSSTGTSSRW